MTDYLLDVNVLVAYAIQEHVHHERVVSGLSERAENGDNFCVCPIVELGLIRNSMRIGGISIKIAKQLMTHVSENLVLKRIPDSVFSQQLPNWIQGYRQTTDAYLVALAEANGCQLLTLDVSIPGAEAM